ncbi:MAG: GatB/YqeY domain-containing protein [Synergistaceae bacterium]|nr:GatB/YqeY domain-containing protein [Synergistaceae bacterium]
MTDLVLRIQNDMVDAMKKRDELKLSALRMLKAAIQMAQIEKGRDLSLSEDEVLVIVRRLIKQRSEAAEMYSSGGAQDRAEIELEEAKILGSYQPEQLSDEEIEKIVIDILSLVGASGPKDMGKVMGKTVAAVKGRADGERIKKIVLKHLSPKA